MAPIQNKSSLSVIIPLLALVIIAGLFYYFTRPSGDAPVGPSATKTALPPGAATPPTSKKDSLFAGKTEPTVVKEENLKIPVTQKVTVASGRAFEGSSSEKIQTPLVPQSAGETVVVPLATFTVKGAYTLALKEATAWRSNAQLSFVKSLGAVTVDGKSSQWQLVFVSPSVAKKAYEVIVQGNAIVSKKEIESTAVAAKLPDNWFDSDEALKRLAALPQFVNALISGINFFYNPDAKAFRYAIATDLGNTSLALQ